jgi:hypothetical protein
MSYPNRIHSPKETMKIILIVIAVAFGAIQIVAGAAVEPAWSLEGRMISADSCGVDCHCIIGGPPDNGLCKFFAISQVDSGQYGDVKLDGVKYGLAGEFALKIIGQPIKRSFVAYYIDSDASAEQKEALRKLFTGPSFAGMGQAAEITEAAIKFEGLDGFGQVGKMASGTVGEIAKVEVTPIAGGTNSDKPLVVENEAEPGLKWTALGKASNSFYRSAGKDYKFEGTSGESHKFAFKGGAEK